MLRLYAYKNCDTCRRAKKWLTHHQIDFELLPIRDTPPETVELEMMLRAYEMKLTKLFNTSGRDYRDEKIKEKLPDLERDAIFELLRSNGNLVKRPFLVGEGVALVGFKEEEWRAEFAI